MRAINKMTAGRSREDRWVMRNYDLGKISVLVVEKHLLIRNLLRDVFHQFGVLRFRSTSDPTMAFQMYQGAPADLILSDWTYDLDGLTFIRMVRRRPDSANPYVPIVMVTANTEMEHVCMARDAGMTEFLAKPVSAALIYSRICSVIERNRDFIRASDFFGPDRRRRAVGWGGGERRQFAAIAAAG